MPYIKEKYRKIIDPGIDDLSLALGKAMPKDLIFPPKEYDGFINYIICTLLNKYYNYDSGYFNYNRAIGILECAKLEIYRKIISSYEDLKAKENGEVFVKRK